ncbi:SPOR domain-containing protein [Thermomonas paludicola]|uniref:SPOR domain-containing protein n=1 Tax=Thermomonas paludicola TaxID=2884874 RepID=UPI0021145491|nr:SPOR domain-containing protein [Thermomonas paludicola]
MAARRGKSQAKRNASGRFPGWAWLIIGVALTLLAVLLVPRYLKSDAGDGFFRPKPNPDALPAAVSNEGEAIAPDSASSGASSKPAPAKPTQYDFYTLLPGQEVAMSDAELAASAKAEADARAQQQATATAASAGANPPASAAALPAPIGDKPADAAAGTAAATQASKPAPAADKAAPGNARYILQAGAFGASGDAETTKAKIALLGLNARVESAQIDGKTVYRVRMGPYGSASELADAKAKLASGGLPAMAVKTN